MNFELDFELAFALQIATQALESLQTFFTEADASLDSCALGEKLEFCVVVPHGMRELLDFKTDLAKDY